MSKRRSSWSSGCDSSKKVSIRRCNNVLLISIIGNVCRGIAERISESNVVYSKYGGLMCEVFTDDCEFGTELPLRKWHDQKNVEMSDFYMTSVFETINYFEEVREKALVFFDKKRSNSRGVWELFSWMVPVCISWFDTVIFRDWAMFLKTVQVLETEKKLVEKIIEKEKNVYVTVCVMVNSKANVYTIGFNHKHRKNRQVLNKDPSPLPKIRHDKCPEQKMRYLYYENGKSESYKTRHLNFHEATLIEENQLELIGCAEPHALHQMIEITGQTAESVLEDSRFCTVQFHKQPSKTTQALRGPCAACQSFVKPQNSIHRDVDLKPISCAVAKARFALPSTEPKCLDSLSQE